MVKPKLRGCHDYSKDLQSNRCSPAVQSYTDVQLGQLPLIETVQL